MGHFTQSARGSVLAVFGVTIIASGLLFAGADGAAAAKAKAKVGAPAAPVSEAEQKQKDASQTRQAYEAGIKSYSSGKFQPAVDELSGALRGGGLGSAEMAKALYVRGMAYKRLSKPGLAISDLTSALWLKNGLGEGDQKNAIAERADSYRMAGLGDGNSGNDAVSVADPNPVPAGAKAAAPAAAPIVAAPKAAKTAAKAVAIAPAAGPTNAPAVTEVTRQAPDSQAAIDAANARRLASTPVETGGLQSVILGNLNVEPAKASQPPALAAAPAASSTPAPVAAAIPAPIPAAAAASAPVLAAAPIDAAPTTTAATAAGGALNSVTGFFSNMFSGGSKTVTAPATAAPITTASTSPTAATSSWADSTSVANGASKKSAAAAPVATATAAAPVAVARTGGKYKIHIAAVRSKAEAEALAQKLSAQNGAALKSRSPVVDEAVIGSMGTFYRVRVGSYATAEEPRGVCNTLRASGFDCLVVTN